MIPKTFVLGGVKSGKSLFAEQSLCAYAQPWHYIATAQAQNDNELQARIKAHQARRNPEQWRTYEIGADLSALKKQLEKAEGAVLFDCLTLWLSHVLFADQCEETLADKSLFQARVNKTQEQILDFLDSIRQPFVMVSNEVGLGGVAENTMMRRFMDAQGQLNQAIAARCDRVYLVAAGLPLCLKDCS